jgi:DNA polymerase elongation subunit (family B)
METTGLDPAADEIITIQIRRRGRNKIWKSWQSDEFSIIESFLDFLKSVDNDEPIYGYNILKFDLPFLLSRIASYRTRSGISRSLWRLIFNKRWLDLYQILGDSYLGLREWIAQTKLERQSAYQGSDIPNLFRNKRHGEITRYINEELRLQEALFDWIRTTKFYYLLVKLQHSTNPEKIERLLKTESKPKRSRR